MTLEDKLIALEQKLQRIYEILSSRIEAKPPIPEEGEQEALVRREFDKLAMLDRLPRQNLKMPKECFPPMDINRLESGGSVRFERVPLSLLVNRCKARRCFSKRADVVAVIKQLYVVKSLHQFGLRLDGTMLIVVTKEEAQRIKDTSRFVEEEEPEKVEKIEKKPEPKPWEAPPEEEKPTLKSIIEKAKATTVEVVDVVEEEPPTTPVVEPQKIKFAYAPDEDLPPADFPPDTGWDTDEGTEVEIYREVKPLDIKVKNK